MWEAASAAGRAGAAAAAGEGAGGLWEEAEAAEGVGGWAGSRGDTRRGEGGAGEPHPAEADGAAAGRAPGRLRRRAESRPGRDRAAARPLPGGQAGCSCRRKPRQKVIRRLVI